MTENTNAYAFKCTFEWWTNVYICFFFEREDRKSVYVQKEIQIKYTPDEIEFSLCISSDMCSQYIIIQVGIAFFFPSFPSLVSSFATNYFREVNGSRLCI